MVHRSTRTRQGGRVTDEHWKWYHEWGQVKQPRAVVRAWDDPVAAGFAAQDLDLGFHEPDASVATSGAGFHQEVHGDVEPCGAWPVSPRRTVSVTEAKSGVRHFGLALARSQSARVWFRSPEGARSRGWGSRERA
jgi:hypothetical protein